MRKKRPLRRRKQKKRRLSLAQALEQNRPAADEQRERRCIVTGERGSPDGLIRFVLSPEGVVAPDYSGKLPGRGAWVTARRDMVDAAVHRRLFARSFKAPAETPDDLGARVDAGLARAALSALGLGRRCGDVATGFEKTRAALKAGKSAVLIMASDGAENGREKVAALAQNIAPVALFARAELSAALGVDAVHATFARGPAAARFAKAAARLASYRGEAANRPEN